MVEGADPRTSLLAIRSNTRRGWDLEDRAATAYAQQLSTERDARLRERLGKKIERARGASEFHRDFAAKLRAKREP